MAAKTDTTPYKGRQAFYAVGFVAALLIFGASAFAAHKYPGYMGWEIKGFDWINDWPNKLRLFFLAATIAPESLWIGLAGVVAAFAARLYRLTWRLSIAIIGGYSAAFLAKHIIGRARPAEVLTGAHIRAHETGAGFPSGHTMVMTVIMLVLLPYLPRYLRWIVPVFIVLMALSRLYLGVHAPLDVIGGFAIGLGVVSFLRILPQSIKVALRLD